MPTERTPGLDALASTIDRVAPAGIVRAGLEWRLDGRAIAVLRLLGAAERPTLCCAAPPGVAAEMVSIEPERFVHPPITADGADWVGVHLDGTGDATVDWPEIGAMLTEACTVSAGRPGPTELDGDLGAGEPSGHLRFTARLWRHHGDAAWHFVTLPTSTAHAVNAQPPPFARGFGSRKVRVVVGDSTWSTSVFPDSSTGSFVLPVKKSIRTAERIDEGDDVSFLIELLDLEPG